MWQTKLSLEKPLFRNVVLSVCIASFAGCSGLLLAQEAPSGPPPNQQQAPALAPQQLDNLVAPIALYPDPLLSQVLVASTYPLELVEAQQWREANKELEGRQLTDAARQQNWDASVQAMVALPDVLANLTQDVQWTTALGNAFLAQQTDVMSAVQRMRARAQANGRLQSTPQETVTTERQDGQAAIQILPADPQVIYVPTYDPAYVWGPPLWGYYPPLFYPAFGFGFGSGIDIGFCFGSWGGWGFGGWGWGWGPNWFGGGIFVNGAFFNHYGYRGGFGGGFGGRYGGGFGGRSAWLHDPGHRLGVGYPNRQLSSRYGAASQASRMAAAGRSGNGQGFGGANGGNRNSFAGSGGTRPQAGGTRGAQSPRTPSSGWQRFDAPGQNSGRTSSTWGTQSSQSRSLAQGSQGAQRSYGSQTPQRSYGYQGAQRSYGYSAGSQQRSYGYQGSSRSYSYASPQRSYSAAPRSAPSSGGNGGYRGSSGGGSFHSSGGGGGGGFHSSGGGGGGGSHSSGGGGGHGGRR